MVGHGRTIPSSDRCSENIDQSRWWHIWWLQQRVESRGSVLWAQGPPGITSVLETVVGSSGDAATAAAATIHGTPSRVVAIEQVGIRIYFYLHIYNVFSLECSLYFCIFMIRCARCCRNSMMQHPFITTKLISSSLTAKSDTRADAMRCIQYIMRLPHPTIEKRYFLHFILSLCHKSLMDIIFYVASR